jgi:acetylglutamate synthase
MTMNVKFNLEAIEVNIPAGEYNPEINVALKGLTYEVTDMSLTEYTQLWKMLITEGSNMIKEFARVQEEVAQAQFEREQKKHAMRMEEIRASATSLKTSPERTITTEMQAMVQEAAEDEKMRELRMKELY